MRTALLLLAIVLATTVYSSAQGTPLTFDQHMIDCEDTYVVLQASDGDTTATVMYVYLDRTAGLSWHWVTAIGFTSTGVAYQVESAIDTTKMRLVTRIDPRSNTLVAKMPESMRTQLGLPAEPWWLATYRDPDPIKDAALRSYYYNGNGFSKHALKALLPHVEPLPDNQLFTFELLFTYNALQQFDSALGIIDEAESRFSDDLEITKEVGYTYMATRQLDEAIRVYTRALDLCDTTFRHQEVKAELCLNLAAIYQHQGELMKSREWIDKAKAVVPSGSSLEQRVKGL